MPLAANLSALFFDKCGWWRLRETDRRVLFCSLFVRARFSIRVPGWTVTLSRREPMVHYKGHHGVPTNPETNFAMLRLWTRVPPTNTHTWVPPRTAQARTRPCVRSSCRGVPPGPQICSRPQLTTGTSFVCFFRFVLCPLAPACLLACQVHRTRLEFCCSR